MLIRIRLCKSQMYNSNGNRGGVTSIFDPGGLSGDPIYWGLGDSLLCDMDANDTATINFAYNRVGHNKWIFG